MGNQKKRLAINMMTILVYTIYEKWEEKKLAPALFIDIKEVFNYILKMQLFN